MGRPRELTEAEREKLRADGFRPIEVWVPDLDRPDMRERLRRELEAIREVDLKSGELDVLSETVDDLADDFR